MKRTKFVALAAAAAIGAGALFAAQAGAQQPAPPPAPGAPNADSTTPPAPPPGPGAGPRWGGPGMGGQGMGGPGMGRRGGRDRAEFSDADRAAFLSARLAAVKAGLMLSPEQEKLWPAAESAVRDSLKLRQDWRQRMQKEGRPANPVDGMRRMGEMATARGEAMKKLADAVGPLYASLSDDQKRRLGALTRGGFGGRGMGMGMGQGMGPRGDRGHGHHNRGWGGQGGRQDGQGPRWRQGDERGPVGRRGWRQGTADEGFDRGAGLEDWRRL